MVYNIITLGNSYTTMPYKTSFPPVRISPIAKEHLQKIVDALKAKGLRVSGASFLTGLILSQPIPNGHKPDPCGEEEEKQL
jgi:hypothetical protein